MLKQGPLWALAALVCVAGFAVWLGISSPPPQSPANHYSTNNNGNASNGTPTNSPPSPVEIIVWPLVAGWSLVRSHPSDFISAVSAIITAAATAAIAIFTVRLWRVGKNQIREAKSLRKIAKRQMVIASTQSILLGKQKEIQQQQFLAEYRPRLKVRHVSVIDSGNIAKQPGMGFSHNAEITGSLVIVNAGGTKAKNVQSKYRIFCSRDGLPAAAPYDEDFRNLLLVDQVLDVGESCTIPLKDKIFLTPPPNGTDLVLRQFMTEGWSLYVMGQVWYRDEGGNERFMGFCRKWGADGKFGFVNDPDYEYED